MSSPRSIALSSRASFGRRTWILHDRQRAEDVAQEAFIQLLAHWSKVSRYEQPGAWVRRVAIRIASRSARREWLRPVLEQGTEPAPIFAPQDVDLLNAIKRLPTRQRAAVALFYFEDRPLPEVANVLEDAHTPPRRCMCSTHADDSRSFSGRRSWMPIDARLRERLQRSMSEIDTDAERFLHDARRRGHRRLVIRRLVSAAAVAALLVVVAVAAPTVLEIVRDQQHRPSASPSLTSIFGTYTPRSHRRTPPTPDRWARGY